MRPYGHTRIIFICFLIRETQPRMIILSEKRTYITKNKRKALNLFIQIKRLRAIQFALNASFAGQELIDSKGTEYFI